MKKITFLWSLLLLFVGVGAVKAQVEPQISTEETVYEYYMTSVSGVQLQVYSDNDANTLGYGSATERARVKIVSVETEAQDELYHIYVTNYEGHTAKVGASGTTNGTFITYGGTNNIWRKKQKEGDNNVWYFTLVDNEGNEYDNVAFTAFGSKKIGLYNYTGTLDNQAYRWKFYPANDRAYGFEMDNIESGYYTIHNMHLSDKYLKNDVSVNANNETLQQTFSYPDNSLVKDQFIWKVDVDNIHFTLLNAQGTPVKVGTTTYPTMDVIAKMGDRTYVFDNYLNRDNSNDDDPHTLHTYQIGGTTAENQWAFTKVEGTAYNVVLENELPGSLLKRTDTEGEVPEGGFFFVTQASGLTADGLKATLVPSGADNGRTPASVTIEGTTITVVYSQDDEYYKLFLLGEKIAHYESIQSTAVGTTPGFYDEEKFTAALDKAKAFHDAGVVGHTPEEVVAVGETLDAEITAALIKVTPGMYMIVSGFSNYNTNQGEEKAMVSNHGLKWNTLDAERPAQYWVVEEIAGEEDAFYVRNLADGKFMNCTGNDVLVQMSATSKSKVTFNYFSTNGKVQINAGDYHDLHTKDHSGGNGVSGDVVGWNGDSNNDASCWYIRPVDGSALADVKTYQVVNSRVSALEEGKKYVIYNTTTNDGRYGYLYNDESKLGVDKVTPSAKVVDNTYLWTLVKDGEKWQIKSESTGKFVDIAGSTKNKNGVSLNISEYTTAKATKEDGTNISIKSTGAASYNDDGTTTAAGDITTADHLWAVHLDAVNTTNNTGCWNGNEGSFAQWSTAHPFAFYEVQEMDMTDEVEILKQQAEALLAKDGVGYPTGAERAALQQVIDNGIYTALENAIEGYQSSTDVKKPEAGKAYRIKNVKYDATTPTYRTVYMTSATGKAIEAGTESHGDAEIFICAKDANGRFAFFNPMYGSSISCRGVQAGYNANIAAFELMSMNSKTFSGAKAPFGSFFLSTLSRNANGGGSAGSLIANNSSDTFRDNGDAMDPIYNNNAYTSVYVLEEVTDPRPAVGISTEMNGHGFYVATYSNTFATVVPEGVEAYAVTAKGETAATELLAVAGEAIPASQGVLLKSQTSQPSIEAALWKPATTETARTLTTGTGENLLAGTGAIAVTVTGDYILANKNGQVGFYKASEGTLKAYRAYLPAEAAQNVKSFYLNFGEEGELTGIEEVEAETPAVNGETVYDLSGRVVRAPQRGGLYIKGGKKFIQK